MLDGGMYFCLRIFMGYQVSVRDFAQVAKVPPSLSRYTRMETVQTGRNHENQYSLGFADPNIHQRKYLLLTMGQNELTLRHDTICFG